MWVQFFVLFAQGVTIWMTCISSYKLWIDCFLFRLFGRGGNYNGHGNAVLSNQWGPVAKKWLLLCYILQQKCQSLVEKTYPSCLDRGSSRGQDCWPSSPWGWGACRACPDLHCRFVQGTLDDVTNQFSQQEMLGEIVEFITCILCMNNSILAD